ncbi:MAG: hypothetical protein IKE38_05355 [Erysipelotrichaceae bacterium]|nr:hypothetical protein [Erysipelotrichaceae bacterium]
MKVKAKGNNTNFTFDDYRNEIRTILERNKRRIKITKVLEKCGISKGNFYVFMNGGKKYKDGIISTLSFSKLDHQTEKTVCLVSGIYFLRPSLATNARYLSIS